MSGECKGFCFGFGGYGLLVGLRRLFDVVLFICSFYFSFCKSFFLRGVCDCYFSERVCNILSCDLNFWKELFIWALGGRNRGG